jgi:hypothetical protein
MLHHLEYMKAVPNNALCGLHAGETKGTGTLATDPFFSKLRILFLSPGKGTMNAPRCWKLRQGYPTGISYCAKISVALWAQKQHNTFPSS